MKKEAVIPIRTLKLWQFRIAFLTIFLSIIIFCLFKADIFIIIFLVILFILSGFIIFWYLPLFFKNYKIYYNEDIFEIHRGVIIKKILIIPYPRLIYITVFSSVISKKLALSGAILKVSRGFVIIPELNFREIDIIRNIVSGEKNEAD